MQVTLDLPDDAFAKADALAKRESRSLGSVIAELIRGMRAAPLPALARPKTLPGQRFPVVEGRAVTEAELERFVLGF